jgi:hypothetical protein
MKRRSFLTGLSTLTGAALLAPWGRQALAADTPPRRFVFVVEGNSYDPMVVMSKKAREAIAEQTTKDTTGMRSFSNFYGHNSPLLIQDGDLGTASALSPLLGTGGKLDLTGQSSVTLGLSSTITGGGHSTYFGGLSSTRSTPRQASGPTIDALLATLPDVRQSTPFDAVRVGVHASDTALNNSTCAFAAGRAAPVIMNPAIAYGNLFGSVADETGRAAFARRADLLSYAQTDVNAAIHHFSGSSTERVKLEAYLSSLEDLSKRHTQLIEIAPELESVVPDGPTVNDHYASEDDLEKLQVQFDLVTAALLGGLTNVAVIASGTGGHFGLSYSNLIDGMNRHDLHHGSDVPETLSIIHEVTRQHVDMVAQLARALAAVPEEGGTMLDNTAIIFLSDNGETHHSSAIEFPVLMVGGQGLGFLNDGRTTVFPGVLNSENRQLSNLFNTLGHAGGMSLDDFGAEASTRIAYGPLSELRV